LDFWNIREILLEDQSPITVAPVETGPLDLFRRQFCGQPAPSADGKLARPR